MVFPFAGCAYKDDHLLALVQQEMDRFGLIVRLLVVYLMEYFPETVFILRREGVPVTDDGIRDESPADVFIHFDTPLTLEHELALLRAAGFSCCEAVDSIAGATFLRGRK